MNEYITGRRGAAGKAESTNNEKQRKGMKTITTIVIEMNTQ